MYVSTFYSYKGGVGRTFALMNVAVELAKNGRNVLVVDFDLEAPGIDTFAGFENKSDVGGIVQFVTDYVEEKIPPNVNGYIYEAGICSHEYLANKGKIWVMPAGRRNAGYDQQLSKIHWQQLYEEMEGFLLFEDLKRQWKSEITPDYVLIDSRTGHTDVGGICTRQLADLVTVLFTPNEQNLKGLPPIVKAIRHESESLTDRKIELCFVASNIPTLDDEEGILRSLMAQFGRAFRDVKSKTTRILSVQRYDSLQLLNQDIFTLKRPNSRLAKQYREIFQVMVEQNLDDRLGVLDYLKSHVRIEKRRSFEDGNVDRRIASVLLRYPSDAEIVLWVARCYKARSIPANAISLLEKLLLPGGEESASIEVDVRLELAELYITNQQIDEAYAQLDVTVQNHTLEDLQIRNVIRLWRLTDRHPTSELTECIIRTELDEKALESLTSDLSESKDWQFLVLELLICKGIDRLDSVNLLHALLLSLIGVRRFAFLPEIAAKLVAVDPKGVANRFNVAMAAWAVDGVPSRMAFAQFVELLDVFDERRGANFYQCVSLAYAVLGEKQESIRYLEVAHENNIALPLSKFSCWRYFKVSPAEFESDLIEMRSFLETGNPVPLFLRDNRSQME